MRYFEDLSVGDRFDLGEHTVTESEIREFAAQYDPQPFHVDPERAEESIFGGLVASGWHTACVCTRLFVEGFVLETANLGGRGVNDLRWRRPVRPGDTLAVSVVVESAVPSERHPDRGDVEYRLTATNGDGEVLSLVYDLIVERRQG